MLIGIALILLIAFLIFYPKTARSVVIQEAQAADKVEEEIVVIEEVKPEPPTISELIEKYAARYKVDASLALEIAHCESKLNPNAKNKYSTASGVFQFLRGSWGYYGGKLWGSTAEKNVFNAEHNIELAMYVMSKRGTTDWNASRHCWA